MLHAHQLQGELAIPVHTYMQTCPHEHAPGGANIRASSCPKVPGAVIAVASVRPFLPGHCCRNLGYVASVGPFLPGHNGPVLARRHNRAKRFPHARTRWRKHPCKKRGPGHCCWETTVFSLTE